MATPTGRELTVSTADSIEVAGGRIASQRVVDPRELAQAFGM